MLKLNIRNVEKGFYLMLTRDALNSESSIDRYSQSELIESKRTISGNSIIIVYMVTLESAYC